MASTISAAPPNTAICRAVEDYVRGVSPPHLFNHVMRSYLFADVAGQIMRRHFDRELLFAATVLHDLGLTDEVPAQERFEVEGADAARRFLAARGMADADLDLVWDAIALHTTQTVPQRKQPVVALCQLGTAIDVGYAPLEILPDDLVADILAAYPRLAFKQAFLATLARVHERNPQAAAASGPVSDVCERHVHGFRRLHFCDVLAGAAFAD